MKRKRPERKEYSMIRIKHGSTVTYICTAVLFVISVSYAEENQPGEHTIVEGDPIYRVLPAGAIPAIMEPVYVSGHEAATQMSPDEPVMGLLYHGEARAYSLWQLDSHEIVNDEIGGIPLAVTW
jgi:hypothetical protein